MLMKTFVIKCWHVCYVLILCINVNVNDNRLHAVEIALIWACLCCSGGEASPSVRLRGHWLESGWCRRRRDGERARYQRASAGFRFHATAPLWGTTQHGSCFPVPSYDLWRYNGFLAWLHGQFSELTSARKSMFAVLISLTDGSDGDGVSSSQSNHCFFLCLQQWTQSETFSRAPVIELLCPVFIKLRMTQSSYLGGLKEKFKVDKTC